MYTHKAPKSLRELESKGASLVEIVEAAAKLNPTLPRYNGNYSRSKTWPTLMVDCLFSADFNNWKEYEKEALIKMISGLSKEAKQFCRRYTADGWYYGKYDEIRAAFN